MARLRNASLRSAVSEGPGDEILLDFGWFLRPMAGGLTGRGEVQGRRPREDTGRDGGRWPQAQGRSKTQEGFFPQPLEEARPPLLTLILGFHLPNGETIHFCCFKLSVIAI